VSFARSDFSPAVLLSLISLPLAARRISSIYSAKRKEINSELTATKAQTSCCLPSQSRVGEDALGDANPGEQPNREDESRDFEQADKLPDKYRDDYAQAWGRMMRTVDW